MMIMMTGRCRSNERTGTNGEKSYKKKKDDEQQRTARSGVRIRFGFYDASAGQDFGVLPCCHSESVSLRPPERRTHRANGTTADRRGRRVRVINRLRTIERNGGIRIPQDYLPTVLVTAIVFAAGKTVRRTTKALANRND